MGRSEGLQPLPGEPQRTSSKLFPVGKEAIGIAMGNITPSSRNITTDLEVNNIKNTNEEFYILLIQVFRRYTTGVGQEYLKLCARPFMDGAMFVHNVFRQQETLTKDQLPIFIKEGKRDDIDAALRKELENVCESSNTIDPSMQDFELAAQRRIRTLANSESPESIFGKAILAQSETYLDTRDKHTFLVGASAAYSAIKGRYEETEEEKRKFENTQAQRETRIMEAQADVDELAGWEDDPDLEELKTIFTRVQKIYGVTDDTSPQDDSDIDKRPISEILGGEFEAFLRQQDQGGQDTA